MKNVLTFFILLIFGFSFGQQGKFFTPVKQATGTVTYPDDRMPSSYQLFKIDKDALLQLVLNAPDQFSGEDSNTVVAFPLADGSVRAFKMFRAHPMSPELEAKAGDNYSFVGIALKSPMKIRLDINMLGVFWGIYHTGKSQSVLQPFDNDGTYITYLKKDQPNPGHVCEVTEVLNTDLQDGFERPAYEDGILRQYDLAFAADGEYSQFHVQQAINNGSLPNNATDAQKKQAVLAALTTTTNRVNEVYETDLAIHLTLVANNIDIIYLDPNSDPYSNNNPGALLSQNQSNLDSVIGSSNYDIGHVATTGGGGLAGLGVVCVNGQKARGETGSNSPVGDAYDIDYVAHEMGHQFGANHTFANSCGGNRNSSTAVEPGSGSTIMAYAGICSPNIQQHSDDYFHVVSQDEIKAHITSHSCHTSITLTHGTPTISVGPDKYIPKETPFIIEATANDATDNATLTYVFDEIDAYNGSNSSYTPSATETSGPAFRSLGPRTENYRYFPKLSSILDGSYGNTWESLPSVTRTLSFDVVVRDNHPGGGQVQTDRIYLGVRNDAGPFRITSQQTDETWSPGDTKTITWNVAGTDGGQVNTPTVDIYLSTDNGASFSQLILGNTPNDGSETITVPNVNTPNGRIIVRGHNNYFFDISKGKITIGNYQTQCFTNSTSPSIAIPDNDPNGITSSINVSQNVTISDVNVDLDISHTYISDLRIKLTSPQGTTVTIFDRACGGQDNLNVTFDDESPAMNCTQMNAGNSYAPSNPLSAFDGENSQGTWTLTVSDHANQDTGTLNSWGLEICHVTTAVENSQIPGLKLYPNPASGYVNVSFTPQSDEQHVQVTDLNGRIIFEQTFSGLTDVNLQIPVASWSPGMYIFKITDGERNHIEKVIKK